MQGERLENVPYALRVTHESRKISKILHLTGLLSFFILSQSLHIHDQICLRNK